MSELIFNDVKLGSDPEFFLFDVKGDRFISSEGLVGGTKENPMPVGNGFFIQEDNVAIEGNIPPSETREEFADNIAILKDEVIKLLPQYELRIIPSAVFDKEFTITEHGKTFGCDPDLNAYTGKMNRAACTPKNNPDLRSAGGHIHVSWEDAPMHSFEDKLAVARAMDTFLGLPSILEDKDKQRSLIYGKAGSLRSKEYGIEYRSLSNYWTKTKELSSLIFDRTMKALEFISDVGTEVNDRRVQKAINKRDIKAIEKLSLEYGII